MYSHRSFMLPLAAMLCLTPFLLAAENRLQATTINGVVLSASADTIVITDSDGKNEKPYKIDGGAAITLDGKPVTLATLAKGDKVKLVLGQDGKPTRIEATRTKK